MERQVPLRMVVRLFVVLIMGFGLMFVAYRGMNPDEKMSAVECPTPSGYLFPPDCGAITPIPCPTPAGDIFPPECSGTAPQRSAQAQVQPVVPATGTSSRAVGAVVAPAPVTCTTSSGTVYLLSNPGTDP
jgi:hypothetical protein